MSGETFPPLIFLLNQSSLRILRIDGISLNKNPNLDTTLAPELQTDDSQ